MKKISVFLVIAVFVAGFGIAATAADPPKVITYEAKMGNVTFDHEAHTAKVADCTTCHHKGVDAGKCASCHDGKQAPKAKDAFHKQCKGCHKEMGGPTGCRDCHKK